MEADMDKQSCSETILQKTERVVPQPQNNRVTRGKLFAQFVCLGLLASSLWLIGLSTQAQDMTKSQNKILGQQSGFLGDAYSKLQPDPKNDDLLVYWKSPDVLKNSNKFILDPVIVYLLPKAEDRGIDPEQLAKLTQYFTNAITDELNKSGNYQIVTEPGPGIMVLRVAITNVEPNGGTTNAVVKGAAVAATHAAAPGAGLLVPRLSVGKVAIEGEIDDSVSGERIVAFMTSKNGRRYFSGLKAYQKWGDIEAAFRAWAKGFRERLDKAHEA
jgi:hypothetical protein